MTPHTVILGAGFGGLEVAARLSDEYGADANVTIIDAAEAFVFGFSKLDMMFRGYDLAAVRLPYSDYARPGVRFVHADITSIDPVAKVVTTSAGDFQADALVVALGAGYDIAATPGLAELGHEFYSVAGAARAAEAIAQFNGGDIVIGVCGQGYKCPPAPHECALLLHDALTERGIREKCSITVVSPLPVPLPPVPDLSNAFLQRYAERGITFIGAHRVVSLESGAQTCAVLDDGSRLGSDLFLGIPVHKAPAVVVQSGLTDQGWIAVDRGFGRTSFDNVYAVGDVTSVGTAKAGVFAERAARVVADLLIARHRGLAEPAGYDGTGECFVELGAGEVGGVSVDFFSREHPFGSFTDPAAVPDAAKDGFGATRRTDWFIGASR